VYLMDELPCSFRHLNPTVVCGWSRDCPLEQ
jgi:hypothetical protein